MAVARLSRSDFSLFSELDLCTADWRPTWDCYWLTSPPSPRQRSSDQSWRRPCS